MFNSLLTDRSSYEILITDVSNRVGYSFELRTIGYDGQLSQRFLDRSIFINYPGMLYEKGPWTFIVCKVYIATICSTSVCGIILLRVPERDAGLYA